MNASAEPRATILVSMAWKTCNRSATEVGTSVRTLTARSPGGTDGWACGNPIGPSSRPPECRSAGRLSRRTTTGFRRPTRLSRPPRVARAAEACIEGLSLTDDHGRTHASVSSEGWGTQSLQVAHEHLAARVV